MKFLKSDIDWLLRMEFVRSEHISASSLLSKIPMHLNKYFVLAGSLSNSDMRAHRLRLARAFPAVFLVGVKV